jgi:sulfur-carrier protein
MIRVRVIIPFHLATLAGSAREVVVEADEPATIASVLDALERAHPALRGTIRFHDTRERRPLVRFFACGEDLSHAPMTTPLPQAILRGGEPFIVLGAIAGG